MAKHALRRAASGAPLSKLSVASCRAANFPLRPRHLVSRYRGRGPAETGENAAGNDRPRLSPGQMCKGATCKGTPTGVIRLPILFQRGIAQH